MADTDFYTSQLVTLIDSRVTGVIKDDENEFFGLQFTTKEGKRMNLWILRDDEGNGPGSIDLEADDQEY